MPVPGSPGIRYSVPQKPVPLLGRRVQPNHDCLNQFPTMPSGAPTRLWIRMDGRHLCTI